VVHKVGMNKFQTYLKDRKIKQSKAAMDLELTQGAISKLATGKIRPDLVTASRIEKYTKGKVPMSCWLEGAA